MPFILTSTEAAVTEILGTNAKTEMALRLTYIKDDKLVVTRHLNSVDFEKTISLLMKSIN